MSKNIIMKIFLCSIFMIMISTLFCTQSSYALGDLFADGKGFLEAGNSIDETIDTQALKSTSDTIYNTLLAIAVVVAVGVAMILGIQFMMASADEKAKVKEAIMPFAVGCMVVFGSFTIWKIAVNIGNDSENTITAHTIPYNPIYDENTVVIQSGTSTITSAQGWIWEGAEGDPPKEKIPSGYTGSFRSWYGPEYHEYWDPDKDGDIDMDDFDLVAGDWDYRQGVIAKMPDSCLDHDGNGLDSGDADYWYEYKTHYKILDSEIRNRIKEEAAGLGTTI